MKREEIINRIIGNTSSEMGDVYEQESMFEYPYSLPIGGAGFKSTSNAGSVGIPSASSYGGSKGGGGFSFLPLPSLSVNGELENEYTPETETEYATEKAKETEYATEKAKETEAEQIRLKIPDAITEKASQLGEVKNSVVEGLKGFGETIKEGMRERLTESIPLSPNVMPQESVERNYQDLRERLSKEEMETAKEVQQFKESFEPSIESKPFRESINRDETKLSEKIDVVSSPDWQANIYKYSEAKLANSERIDAFSSADATIVDKAYRKPTTQGVVNITSEMVKPINDANPQLAGRSFDLSPLGKATEEVSKAEKAYRKNPNALTGMQYAFAKDAYNKEVAFSSPSEFGKAVAIEVASNALTIPAVAVGSALSGLGGLAKVAIPVGASLAPSIGFAEKNTTPDIPVKTTPTKSNVMPKETTIKNTLTTKEKRLGKL